MPNPYLEKQVQSACREFSEASGIQITLGAQVLIMLLLASMETEPHPSWKRRYSGEDVIGNFAEEEAQITKRLPQILQIAHRDASLVDPTIELRKELNIFDLAHNLPRCMAIAARLGGISRI